MARTLQSNKIEQENRKPLGPIEQENRKPLVPRADHEERNKLKVRGINEIAC